MERMAIAKRKGRKQNKVKGWDEAYQNKIAATKGNEYSNKTLPVYGTQIVFYYCFLRNIF